MSEDKNEISEAEILEFKRCFNFTSESIENYKNYGPSNPLKQRFPGDTCLKCKFSDDGICYMLKCKCLEYDLEIDEYLDDWYTGKCDECDSEIIDRNDAWRIPDLFGGFKGCYCEEHFESNFYGTDIDNKYKILCKVIKTIRKKFPVKFRSSSNNKSEDQENIEEYI